MVCDVNRDSVMTIIQKLTAFVRPDILVTGANSVSVNSFCILSNITRSRFHGQ